MELTVEVYGGAAVGGEKGDFLADLEGTGLGGELEFAVFLGEFHYFGTG